MWRLTRQRYLDMVATVIAVAEVFMFDGRLYVLAFAAALFGLRFTLPNAPNGKDKGT